MPSANVSTATAVKPGFFSSWRRANLKSLMTEGLHWIDTHRSSRRQPASDESDGDECQSDHGESYGVTRWQFGHDGEQQAFDSKRADESDEQARKAEAQPESEDEAEDVAELCAERESDANLIRALNHESSDDAVD